MSKILSIITVCYQAEKQLESTILSVLEQTAIDQIEYIIVDGASTDGTLAIIEKYKHKIHQIVSEPDKGIYDAMNKGITLATGQYLWFMNAGDTIFERNTAEKIIQIVKKQQPDVLGGETMIFNEAGKKLGLRSQIMPHKIPQQLTWRSFRLGMVVGHQAFLAKKEIAPLYLLDNLAADIDWEINCLKNAKTSYLTDFIIAKFFLGGISSQKQKLSWLHRYQILAHHFGKIPNIFNHLWIIFRYLIK